MSDPVDIFKESVKEYVNIHKQLADATRSLAQVRRKKQELGELIVNFMEKNNYEVATSAGAKLFRRESKRREGLKEDMIFHAVKDLFGEVEANKVMDNISSRRETTTKTSLSCRLVKD
jgi:uncharacterized protein Yka (UPF0111/DUF47 family)